MKLIDLKKAIDEFRAKSCERDWKPKIIVMTEEDFKELENDIISTNRIYYNDMRSSHPTIYGIPIHILKKGEVYIK